MLVAQVVLGTLSVWVGIGLVFGLGFVTRGLGRVDPDSRESNWGLRLILIPGCLIFWPRLLRLWVGGVRELPVESSSHRRAAATSVGASNEGD